MWLIVGLGNPGERYRDTSHNAGFWVCDQLCARNSLGSEAKKFKGLLRRGRIGRHDVAVLKPQTYMNLSGESVREALGYLPVETHEVIVVYDEMDLPLGQLRIRPNGGHGGHNGMRSVIAHLGTKDFARVRVGVGRPTGRRSPTEHLLSRTGAAQRKQLEEVVDRAAEATEIILEQGVESAMNRFNAAAAIETKKETSS